MAQILGLILIAALLSARSRSTANRLLAGVLCCGVYRQFLLVVTISGTIELFPFLFRSSFPLQLLAIPTFYLYVKALTTPEFKVEPRHAVHLIPFIIGIAWYCAMWVWGSPELFRLGPSYYRDQYVRLALKVFVVIPYLILASRQVNAFALETKEHASDLSRLRLNWLRMLLVIAYVSLAIDALDVVTGPGIPVWYLVPAIGLISLAALAYMSLRVSPVFVREAQLHKTDSIRDVPEEQQESDSSRGRLSDEELERQKKRLTNIVESKALYLNPELRLSDLAVALGIRPYRVSEILSRGLQTTFYDLINSYRVAKAQELLGSPGSAHLNLLGIAMESGFRSKSVFNDVFKKTTGKTPSQFRSVKIDRIA
jgi:AraC-like DNA-binding protein